jgi:hypothetical protein
MADGWLTGWKEIAAYVGYSDQTAKRWKKYNFMPVRYSPGGRPCCLTTELDKWLIKYNEKEKKKKKKKKKKKD